MDVLVFLQEEEKKLARNAEKGASSLGWQKYEEEDPMTKICLCARCL